MTNKTDQNLLLSESYRRVLIVGPNGKNEPTLYFLKNWMKIRKNGYIFSREAIHKDNEETDLTDHFLNVITGTKIANIFLDNNISNRCDYPYYNEIRKENSFVYFDGYSLSSMGKEELNKFINASNSNLLVSIDDFSELNQADNLSLFLANFNLVLFDNFSDGLPANELNLPPNFGLGTTRFFELHSKIFYSFSKNGFVQSSFKL